MAPEFPPPPSDEELAQAQATNEAETAGSADPSEATVPDPEVNEPTFNEPETNEPESGTKSDVPSMSNPENVDYVGPATTVAQDFTYPTHTDPQRHVTSPGIYLDDLERERAEVTRAKLEGREPDLENPPATVGTPLVRTDIVRSNLPGDFIVKPDVSLEVSVGIADENFDNYGEAAHERRVAEAYGIER